MSFEVLATSFKSLSTVQGRGRGKAWFKLPSPLVWSGWSSMVTPAHHGRGQKAPSHTSPEALPGCLLPRRRQSPSTSSSLWQSTSHQGDKGEEGTAAIFPLSPPWQAQSWGSHHFAILSFSLFPGSLGDFSNFLKNWCSYWYVLPVAILGVFFSKLLFFHLYLPYLFLLIGGKGSVKTKGK